MRRTLFQAAMALLGAALIHGGAAAQAPAPPVMLSMLDMGTVQQNRVVSGRDGNFSALVGKTSVWAFADTAMKRPNASGKNFIDNTMSGTTVLNAEFGIVLNRDYLDASGVPARWLGLTAGEQAFDDAHAVGAGGGCATPPCGASLAVWPGPVVWDKARHRVLYFFNEIARIPGDASFKVLGAGVAVGPDGPTLPGTVSRVTNASPGTANPALLWNAPEFGFANGTVVVGDMLYAYGQNPGGLVMHVPLARAPLANATKRAAWTYYAGNDTWSARNSDAVTVFDGGAAGNSVFFNAYLGQYMAIYSAALSNNVYARVAPNPWGPWSEATLLFKGVPGQPGTVDYAALAHPEFATGNGQTQYITYVRTTGFLQMELRLVKVVFGATAP